MSMIKHIFLAGLITAFGASMGVASQVVPSKIEDVAGSIETVLKVRVKEVTQTPKHMTLENGQEGPITHFEEDIKAEVLSVLVGNVDALEIMVKYNMPVLNRYDENGNVELSYSIQIPGTSLEYEIKQGEEYIFCFAPHSADLWKDGPVFLMRAEKPEMEEQVVNAVIEAHQKK